MGFGVYIHFPYCRKRCPYCDFAIAVRREIPHAAWGDAVTAELSRRAPLFAGRALGSIYLGGGTPGLWAPEQVARTIAAVRSTFPVEQAEGAPIEITLEANPDDLPPPALEGFRAAGVNRLSLGAQSLDDRALVQLGRLHGAAEVRAAVKSARAAGFGSISVDLIFGLPGQDMSDLERDLAALVDLGADHLSVYQLTVEERTPFGAYARAGTLIPLPDERLAAMAATVEQRLAAAGYVRYEISSYARPGHRARHNSLYWSGGEWLGLGSSAHSFRRTATGGERWSTIRNVDDYRRGALQIEGEFPTDHLIASHEPLTADTLAREAMWLGLRQVADGVDRAAWSARFGQDPVARFANEIERLRREELVAISDERIVLTSRGRLFADEVGLRFL